MIGDYVVQIMKEVALTLGVDIPEISRENEMDAGQYPVIDISATKDQARSAVVDSAPSQNPEPMPYNGPDLIGYSLQGFVDKVFDRKRDNPGPFGFNPLR